jgi:S1-C subfamily serine protease
MRGRFFTTLALLATLVPARPGRTEGLSGARELQQAFIRVGEQVGPAVVTISVKRQGTSRRGPFGPSGGDSQDFEVASGVLLDRKGHVLTNEHVIAGASEIRVGLSNGQRYRPTVVGADPVSDLAVLRIDATELTPVEQGDSSKLRVGQWAIALGNPFGIAKDAQPTLTVGVISGLRRAVPQKGGRYYGDMIQTDAAVNPGNSGGPLVDIDGKLIGVNVIIFSTTGGYQGIGFAIPVNRAAQIARSLIERGKVEYGWLGIRVGDVSETESREAGTRGAVVTEVLSGSPAEESGIRERDIIVAFDGRPVRTSQDLIRLVQVSLPGRKATLRALRGEQPVEFQVTLRGRAED